MVKVEKPLIGLSGSLIIDDGGMFPGYKRAYVNDDYVDSVLQAGGIPVIIPFIEDEEVITAQIEKLDGVILSGGHDLAPVNYGQEPDQRIGDIFPERDLFDFKILEVARAKNIPVLGICRGAQVINVFQGGTLYQDLALNPSIRIKHSQNQRPDLATHEVTIDKDSKLYDILGTSHWRVNSFHHQVLDQIGADLKVVAHARDGVVEAVEYMKEQWVVGIQWHPEMLHRVDPHMLDIFKALITEAKK